MSIIELQISEKVGAATEVEVESDPIADGIFATVYVYKSHCPDSAKATTRLKFGDDILECMQRSDYLSHEISVEGDGVKTFKLICDDECSSDYYFNAYVKIGLKDG